MSHVIECIDFILQFLSYAVLYTFFGLRLLYIAWRSSSKSSQQKEFEEVWRMYCIFFNSIDAHIISVTVFSLVLQHHNVHLSQGLPLEKGGG